METEDKTRPAHSQIVMEFIMFKSSYQMSKLCCFPPLLSEGGGGQGCVLWLMVVVRFQALLGRMQ